MLFYLSDSLIVDNDDPSFQGIIKAVHNIATYVIDGHHLLTGSYNVISHFRVLFKSELPIGIFFNHLFQNFSTIGVPNDISFYIEIVKENPSCRTINNKTIYQKTYSFYTNINSCSQAVLVCEDLSDTEFYEHILKWYIKTLNFNYHFSIQRRAGGGGNIYKVVQQELDNNHITICIVDKDIKYPCCPIDPCGTYQKCVNNIQSESGDYMLLPLNVHEVENLIPLNYIDLFNEWINGNANLKRNKVAFDYLRKESDAILPYFDYKNGIHKNDIVKNDDYYHFAERCYKNNDDLVHAEPSFEQYVSKKAEKGEVYPSLMGGSMIIHNTLDLIRSKQYPNPKLCDFQLNEWTNIGKNLLNWSVARIPESIY